MMISPPQESEQPPMYSPPTHHHHEPLSLHVPVSSTFVVADPSVEESGDSMKGPDFGGFVPGEEMGRGSLGGLVRDADGGEGLESQRHGGVVLSGDLDDELVVESDTRGVPSGSGEISLLEMKEKPLVDDLEDGFVEGKGGSQQDSGVPLLELKKKQLLHDLDDGCVFGEAVGERALENEGVSDGTLVLDEFCGLDGTKQSVWESRADGYEKMEGSEGGNHGFDLRRSLKIELIDDTAVVEQLLIREVCSMVQKENEMPSGPEKQKEEVVDGKKARRARRKAKSLLNRNEEILGKREDVNARFLNSRVGCKLMYTRAEMEALWYVNVEEQQRLSRQVSHFQNGQGGRKLTYTRAEMEALRYHNVEEQGRFWRQVYDSLGPVAKEYMSLLSDRTQPGPGVDCLRQSFRREHGPGILGEVNLKKVSIEPGNLDQDSNNDVGLPHPSCIPDNIVLNEGISTSDIIRSDEDDEDDDEYYASIQRPAFFVEGEPDFNAGPPEDGLEYLRRVRWEAAQIPDVKVAKLDNRRLNKAQSVYMPEIPEIPDCPVHLLPLKQWEEIFLADFSKLRLALLGIESDTQQFSDKLRHLTSCSDLDHSKSKELEDEQTCPVNEGKETIPAEEAASSKTSQDLLPRLSLILKMDSVARVSMLKKRIKKAESMNSLSRNDCTWLFALCAVVDMPLDSDACAALRSLLRKCASLRAEKAEMDDEIVMLNIMVTVAGKYFGQSG